MDTPTALARARRLYANMTPAERAATLSGDLEFWPGMTDMIRAYNAVPFVSGHNPRLGIQGLRFTDGPRGVAVGASTCFPVSMARGATWDPSLEARVGDVIGVEARAQGANLVAAVCVNLLRHPAWGRAQETYGEDPVHVGAMGAALTQGIQRHAMACVKHFACNSIDNARFRVDVAVSHEDLDTTYLPHFKRCVEAGVACVMSAYNKVNGSWCAESEYLLDTVLRRRWGFEGFVVSDFIFGLRDARRALAAGLDVEMPFRHLFWDAYCRAALDPVLIERAALRVLTTQLRFSDVGEPARYVSTSVACDAHRALARDVAARATVLLQNKPVRGTPLLPLDGSRVTKLAVIGRLAAIANLGDRGSSNVRAPSPVTVLDGLRAALPRASVRHDDGRDLARARDLARDADVVVLTAGLSYRDEGEHIAPTAQLDLLKMFRFPPLRELPAIVRAVARRPQVHSAGDRTRLTLHPRDEALIKAVVHANPATIVVLMGGSALITEAWRHQVPAVLMAWYPGIEGGHAIADVLLGRAEPGGRLPSVWPRSEAGLPFFDRNARHIRYDDRLGQRALDAYGIDAAFSLAHGLTYTRFRQTLKGIEARSDDCLARVVVENIGPRRGSELVTVWRHVSGAPSRLAGFSRVVLDPGEAKTIEIVAPLTCDAENLHLARRSAR